MATDKLKQIGDAISNDYLGFIPTSNSTKPPHIANGLFRYCIGETCDTKDIHEWMFEDNAKNSIPSEEILEKYEELLQNGFQEKISDIKEFRFLLEEIFNQDNGAYAGPANYGYSKYHSAYIFGNNAYYIKGSELLALQAGTYQIKAMTYNKASGEYKPVLIPSGGSTYITAECDGTKVTLTPEAVGNAKLEVKSLSYASKLYSGQDFMIAVSLQSRNAEYLNDVSLLITQGEGRFATLVYESDPVRLAIPTTKPYTYVFKGTIPEGLSGDNFNLQVKNGNGLAVYSEVVTIGEAPTDALKLTLAGCSLNGVLNVNNVNFTADIKCEQGFFGGKITPYAYYDDNDETTKDYIALAAEQAFVIESGTTYTMQFFAETANLPLGKEYELRLMARPSSGESSTIIVGPKFTTSNVSGITVIKADAAVNHSGTVNVYDVQGRKLYSADAESFDINDVDAKGVLIIRSAAGVQKVVK